MAPGTAGTRRRFSSAVNQIGLYWIGVLGGGVLGERLPGNFRIEVVSRLDLVGEDEGPSPGDELAGERVGTTCGHDRGNGCLLVDGEPEIAVARHHCIGIGLQLGRLTVVALR